jgi:chromosome segregation ATPase
MGLSVPVGEFDTAHTLPDPDRLRVNYEQSTIKRDPAGRGDPTTLEPAAFRAERGDPTLGPDQTGVHVGGSPGGTPKGRLRTIAQLRRKSGLGGDMRYVLTAIFGLRRARRELAELDAKQATRQQSRRRHLTTLGRTAVTADGFDHVALARARELLAGVEEERSRHAGQVVAADAELQRVTRDREAKAKQYAADLEEVDAEIVDATKKLEPLEKEIAGVTRRAADLRDAMRRIDEKIAFTEASLSSIDTEKEDRAAIEAEIASLRADRKLVQQDEPELASALDSLHPRIAKLEAARAEARRRRTELEQAEREDQRRTEELLAAIGAKRVVVDRAAADAEAARDKIMFELGERLYVDRPDSMSPELSPIDAIDVELGTGDRRMMELREILQSVDRMKIVRGVGLWILLLAALGGIAALALGVPLPV